MRYTYQSDYASYRQAMRLYIRSSPWRRLYFHLYYWVIGAIGAFLLLTAWLVGEPHSLLRDVGIPVGGWLLLVGFVVLALRPWQLRRICKVWNGELQSDSVLYLEFDGPTMITGLDNSRETRFQRGGFCRVIDDESMVLLFLSKKKFMYLSKIALPPAAFEELREWLAQPGAPKEC